jgi:hypothetical protein
LGPLRFRFWNDPVALEKLGKAFGNMGGIPGMPPGFATRGIGGAGADDNAGDEEEDEEEEDEDAPELHKAVTDAEGSAAGVMKVIEEGGKGALLSCICWILDLHHRYISGDDACYVAGHTKHVADFIPCFVCFVRPPRPGMGCTRTSRKVPLA